MKVLMLKAASSADIHVIWLQALFLLAG